MCVMPLAMASIVTDVDVGARWRKEWKDVTQKVIDITSGIFVCMFGTNFLVYIATSSRMRDAYSMFLCDLWTAVCSCLKPEEVPGGGNLQVLKIIPTQTLMWLQDGKEIMKITL